MTPMYYSVRFSRNDPFPITTHTCAYDRTRNEQNDGLTIKSPEIVINAHSVTTRGRADLVPVNSAEPGGLLSIALQGDDEHSSASVPGGRVSTRTRSQAHAVKHTLLNTHKTKLHLKTD